MKNGLLICMMLFTLFIAGCSGKCPLLPDEEADRYDGIRLTYYQWQNLSDNEKYIYVDRHIEKFGINIDADAGRTVEALNELAKHCDKECSETLMSEVISGLTTAYVLKSE